MKKISYRLQLGLVGSDKSEKDSGKEIFIEFLKDKAYEYNELSINGFHEFLLIFDQIPIKMKLFSINDLNDLILNHEKIKKLDIIILALNIYDTDSTSKFNKELYEEFKEYYKFQGSSVLAGIDVESVFSTPSQDSRISKSDIINKAKELNILYTFEIQNKTTDLSELFNKILDDFIFQIRIKTPELFDQAQKYGKELSIKKKSIRDKL